MARTISKILFILGSYDFLAYLECVRSYAWSKCHSESDLGSVCSICSRKVLTLTLIFYSVCALYQLYMNWTGPIGRKNQIQMSCPGQLGLPVSQMSGKRKNVLFFHSNNLIPTKPIKSFVKISFSLAKKGNHW